MAIKINGSTVISDSQEFTSTSTASVTGNITGGNILTGGAISATGNVSAANFNGNVVLPTGSAVSTTGTVTGGNVSATGTVTGGTVVGGGVTLSANTISSSGSTLTIDPASAGTSGLVVIAGNLSVQGTTTTYDSTTITINDLLFTVANNAATSAAANGGGIEVGPVGSSYATWTYDQPNSRWSTALGIGATGNISGGNISVGTGTITGGNIVNANANGVGNIGSATTYFNTVFAKATSAQYADLAEKYEADAEYAPGTVVAFGGEKEVTLADEAGSTRVAGVVSTNPSYIMNASLEAAHVAMVALQGRVPCKVVGTVRKGDMMVAAGNGAAKVDNAARAGSIIGKALENFDGAEGTIEVVIGRN